jgi:hypothetical protein
LEESEPQDIGPRGKATTVHLMEQEAVLNGNLRETAKVGASIERNAGTVTALPELSLSANRNSA